MFTEAFVALGATTVLSFGAWKRGSLSISGSIAATGVGFWVWAGLGRVGFAALCAFFLTSTLLGRVGKTRKRPLQLDYEKGDRRDAWQVFANGGVAASIAVWVAVVGDAGWFPDGLRNDTTLTLVLAALASLASANADTWATELGVLWPRRPRSLWTWRPVPAGSSGAVSPGGLAAAFGGALLIGLVATQVPASVSAAEVLWLVTGAGFFGAFADSALGKVQRQYACGSCGKTVETRHHCGHPTTCSSSRFAVLNNDGVNCLANTLAALVVALVR